MSKRALVLGIGGQDGSYIADILLAHGYEVHGLYRRSSTGNLSRIQHIIDRVVLHQGDMADPLSVERAVIASRSQEIYNEADQDSVGWSHQAPCYTYDITFGAVGRLLETVRTVDRGIRVFQPCTAMMFGDAAYLNDPNFPDTQNENTPLRPMSPYACAKAGALHLCRFYREHHGLFVSCSILYNHDSVRRGEEYLLHKIAKAAVRISRGQQETLALGNLDARVDIGSAYEYMQAAHNMLQLNKPDDFVIATGIAHHVSAMVARAFERLGIDRPFDYITRDDRYWFPVKGVLRGNSTKACKAFGFSAKHTSLTMIDTIVDHYLQRETV